MSSELEVEAARIREEYERRRVSTRVRARYDLANRGPRAVYWSMIKGVDRMIESERLDLARVGDLLDVGCGAGGWARIFLEKGLSSKAYHGVELLEDRVERALIDYPLLDFRVGDGSSLPFAENQMDVVFQSMALSSIVSMEMRTRFLREMWRVLKPQGLLISYDMRWVRRSPHLRRVLPEDLRAGIGLPPDHPIQCHPSTVLPPLMRLTGGLSSRLAEVLDRCSWLHSHLFLVVRKP